MLRVMPPLKLSLPSFSPARLRSYLLRLPLFTRATLVIILIFWIVELQNVWSVTQWGSLIPKEINLGTSAYPVPSAEMPFPQRLTMAVTVYRLNTFPFIHWGFLHAFFNVLCLTPLMERFEAEHGTLVSAAMFGGRE